MTVLPFPSRRMEVAAESGVRTHYQRAAVLVSTGEGRDLAELCAPFVEPFRICEPELAQGLIGAFLRWQIAQTKTTYGDDRVVLGLAMSAVVEAFTRRLDELQSPYDQPPEGDSA